MSLTLPASPAPRDGRALVHERHEHYVVRLLKRLERSPAEPVVHWQERWITSAEFSAAVLASASRLAAAGVDASSTVAVCTAPNDPAALVARYGAHLLGAAVTHVRSANARSDNDCLPAAEQVRILRDTSAMAIVVDLVSLVRGRVLAAQVRGLEVICLDGDDAGAGGVRSAGEAERILVSASFDPAATAVIDLTSGTTARPKLVRHTFASREARVRLASGTSEHATGLTLLSVTPITHATASLIDAVLIGGGRVVIHEEFDAGRCLQAIAEHAVTDVYLAVPHLYRVLDHPRLRTTDVTSLRQVLYTGTPVAPGRIAQALDAFGGALTQLYGSTEAGGICRLTPEDHAEPLLRGSAGRPFPWVELQLRPVNDPAGAEVERGAVGEVHVRSSTLMAGYLGEPRARHWSSDGWLRTGDLARCDAYGYLHLVGRAGDVVKAGGLKLHPATIERVLVSHPLVADAAVFAVRDDDYIEQVRAAVQLRPGARCTTAELSRHVAVHLSPAHVPAHLTFWKTLPLNASGKPDRGLLRTAPSA